MWLMSGVALVSTTSIEVTLGGVKAIYDGGRVIRLVDRLTDKDYDVINVWDDATNSPRIEFSARDVWIEMDRALHFEEPRNQR